MSLFEYHDAASKASIQAVRVGECMFCSGPLKVLHDADGTREIPRFGVNKGPGWERWDEVLKRCMRCGWWLLRKDTSSEIIDHYYTSGARTTSGAAGCLKRLDVSYGDAPIQEVRDYLIGRYDERFKVHPRKLEEVVASVFRDLGYQTILTNYSGDDGVDVFMTKGTDIVGVQVKRYKAAIGVEQIRELAGALLLNDLTKGVFVTTSSFQSGAESTAARFAMRGMPIELIDADRFYGTLEIAQTEHYQSADDDLLNRSRSLSTVLHNEQLSTKGKL